MRILNLQQVKLFVEARGYTTGWYGDALVVHEQRRIVKYSGPDYWVVCGATPEEMRGAQGWDLSLALGGPPYWTTASIKLAFELSARLNIPIEEAK